VERKYAADRTSAVIDPPFTIQNAHLFLVHNVLRVLQDRDGSWTEYTDDDPPYNAYGECIDSFT
jgi:hypothetical protein